jgi:chain length determinant protein EpsF
MNLRQILLVLRLRWWLVLGLFVAVVGGAFILSVNLPKQYTAETSVLLDVKTDPLLSALMPQVATPAFIATETEIIRSERVASRVVQMLGLAQSPAAVAQWREATQGRIPMESYFGGLLQKGLAVELARGSTLLSLTFTGSDPKFAAAAANAFARAYIDLSVELRVEPARQYNTFYDERLKNLRAELEAAQTKLSAFQQAKGIVASDERVDLETGRLNAIMAQLATAQAEMAETSSRARNTGSETSPDVQQNTIVQTLKGELARLETKLSEISSFAGSNHPQRVQLEAQIGELKRQIIAEMRRVSGATVTVNRVTGQKIAELKSMGDAQKQHVLSLRAERDEMSVLQKDVQTAQRAYESVAQRRSQVSLESQANQASARVLSAAVEPIKHSKPNIPKNMAVALIAGLMLGVGAAMAWEFLDRRVRSVSDLQTPDGLPVLGVLSEAPGRSREMFGRQRFPALAAPRVAHVPSLTMGGGG